jgi:hypothetical protein
VTYTNCIRLNTDPEPETNITKIVDLQTDNAEHLALIHLWNFEDLNSVNVDLAALNLPNGDYQLRSVQDYFNDRRSVNGYDADTSSVISIDMTTGTVAQPIGETGEDHGLPYNFPYYWETSTMPRYGAFFLVAS